MVNRITIKVYYDFDDAFLKADSGREDFNLRNGYLLKDALVLDK